MSNRYIILLGIESLCLQCEDINVVQEDRVALKKNYKMTKEYSPANYTSTKRHHVFEFDFSLDELVPRKSHITCRTKDHVHIGAR